MRSGAATLATMLCVMLLGGCQTLSRPDFTIQDLAYVSPEIRLDTQNPSDVERYAVAVRAAAASPADGTFDLLALSGGGSDGAYGVGLLVGWSERGDRPQFDVVTGVSTGALMAPFAFIGQAGDPLLQQAFTDGRIERVLEPRWAMSLFGPGLFRQRPLRALVAASVTPDLLAAVAEQHRQGRRLYVATTSLDTQGQVIWDMGALAGSADPGTIDRFIDILTASASIPGVFPPVFVEMRRGETVVRELHVDGRATLNFFLAPESLMTDGGLNLPQAPNGGAGRVWIIINGRPETRFRVTPFGGVDVASRGLDSMMKASTRMNVIASRQFALLNDMTLAVAMAPATGLETSLDFDRARLQALFAAGHAAALEGTQWADPTLR